MTIRLTVDRQRWWRHATDIAASTPGLVPVVKGNGYGFGRRELAAIAHELSPLLAVGNVHELDGLPADAIPVVLTPVLHPPAEHPEAVLTVGSRAHVEALAGWDGRVVVKLTSSMRRYGGPIDLVVAAQQAGLTTVGVALHLPLAGDDDARRAEIDAWLPAIDPTLDVWVSHLAPDTYRALPTSHRYKLRTGSYLWHGDRGSLRLEADVLDVRVVTAGTPVGYHATPAPGDGSLVMIGAGSANGVAPLDDGRSPFHYRRQRVDLVEAPHMHTSIGFVPSGAAVPAVGDWVDLQRPLTRTVVDELRWT